MSKQTFDFSEALKRMRKGHLSTAEIADKYCDCASSELRGLMSAQLEELRRLYKL